MDILVIPTYERPDYLRRTLDSVLEALDDDIAVVLVDDGSKDLLVNEISRKFANEALHTRGVIVTLTGGQNIGVAANMLRGIEYALHLSQIASQLTEHQRIITLDSDFIVRPDFFEKLRWLFETQGNDHTICTGFNAITHPIIKQCDGFAVKRSIGGGNQMYNMKTYLQYVKPSLINNMWDWTVCNQLKRSGGKLLCVTPSICQHIGVKSLLGHAAADKAVDFQGAVMVQR